MIEPAFWYLTIGFVWQWIFAREYEGRYGWTVPNETSKMIRMLSMSKFWVIDLMCQADVLRPRVVVLFEWSERWGQKYPIVNEIYAKLTYVV